MHPQRLGGRSCSPTKERITAKGSQQDCGVSSFPRTQAPLGQADSGGCASRGELRRDCRARPAQSGASRKCVPNETMGTSRIAARLELSLAVPVVQGKLCRPAQNARGQASTKSACLARRCRLHNSVRPPTQKDRHRTLEDPGSRECARIEKLASVDRLHREPRLLGVVRKVQAEHAAGVVAWVCQPVNSPEFEKKNGDDKASP